MFKIIKERFSKRKRLAKNHPEVLRYEELEQRVLFSADVVPGLDIAAVEEQVIVQDVGSNAPVEREAASETVEQTAEGKRSELVFVNENVADHEQLIADLQGSDNNRVIEVVVLESDRDGIEQVSDILSERSDLAAVHVITHGIDGQINLGDSWLNSTTLQQNNDAVAGWGNALNKNGDILFYGCNIAADSAGQSLMDDIADLTGADVAASDDATGHVNQDADWELEVAVGDIEADIVVSTKAQDTWTNLLAVIATDDFSADYTGGSGWTGNWTEVNDDGSSLGGRVKISGGTLQVENAYDSSGNPANYKGTYRQVDLSSASEAILTFDYQRFTPQTGGQVLVDVGYGGGNWRTVATYDLTAADGSPVSSGNLTINASETAVDTQIRFRSTGTDTDAYIQVDNVQITTSTDTTTVDDGTALADRNIWAGGYHFTVNSFTLSTDTGTDTLTDLTVTFTGTDANDVAANGVKIWRDDGGTPNIWDEGDTLLGTATFAGNTAAFTGLTEGITTTPVQYLVTYDIDSAAPGGNTLQGAVTSVTTTNAVVNNDNVDATLTVEANMVHETSVYKMVYAPGIVEELYLKNSSSPTTNIMQGMSIGSVYATTPGSLLLTWDPDATVNTVVDNSSVKQVQMSGRLMHTSGVSYGSVTTNITLYEDRAIFDMSITMDVALVNEWMFMTYGTWNDALLDESFEWSGNNSGTFNTVDPAPNFNSGNQSSPISFQGLFELGAIDGQVNATMQNISNYSTSQIKNTDNDGGSVDIAFQKPNPVLLTTYQASVQYSFDSTTSGFNTTTAEERQDDFVTPATLNFGIAGGDGALTGDGYVEERGAYTLDDNDADDHVRFEFQSTTNHHSPVFEINNWNSADPLYLTVDGAMKVEGLNFHASVTGTTLYIQYLGDISANSILELNPNNVPTIGGAVAGQGVNDTATVSPFTGVTIGDADLSQILTVSVNLDTAAKGTFSVLNGFTDAGGGVYTFSGTAAAATTAIRGLVFDPAENRVAPTLTETTTLTVSVDDGIAAPTTDNTTTVISTSVNDAPVITSDGGGTTAAVNAAENQTAVTTATATDVDTGDTLTYSIDLASPDADKFSINSSTGELTFVAAPDFENPTDANADNVYEVTVQADDGNGGTDTQALSVTVTNVNDNAPVINDLTTSVAEDAANSTVFTNINEANTGNDTDLDGTPLTYSITAGNADGIFAIDANTGEITVANNTNLDYEATQQYVLTVQASDGTNTDTAAVTTDVSNVSDSISGTAFTDEGVTNIGAGKTINVLVNGVSVGTSVTAADGSYTVDTGVINAGDAVVLFIDNDATYKGVTVTIADGSDLAGIDVFADHVMVRHEGGGALTIADMDTALGAYSDTDIGYSVTAGALTMTGGELYISAGHTFTPDGDITIQGSKGNVEINGTLNGGSNTITVSGNWDTSSGMFNYDTSTVIMTGTSKDISTGSPNSARSFYNLIIDTGASITDQVGANVRAGGTLTINGIFNIASGKNFGIISPLADLDINAGGVLDVSGRFFMYTSDARTTHIANDGTLTGSGDFYWRLDAGAESTAAPITATDYGDLRVSFATYFTAGGGGTAVLGGNPGASLSTTGSFDLYDSWDGGAAIILDNSINNLDVNVGSLSVGDSFWGDGQLIAGAATYNISGDVVTDGWLTPGEINAGSSTFNVGGNWDSSAGTFNYGTSTVNMTGSGTIKTPGANYTPYFYNLGLAATGEVNTLQSHVGAANNINLGTGTVTGSYELGTFANNGTPVTNAGATININAFYYRPVNGTVTVAGGNYNSDFWLWPSGSDATFNLGDDLTVSGWLLVDIDTGNSGVVFNTQNNNLTANRLEFGEPNYDGSSTANFGSSTVDINRLRVGSNGGDHVLNLDSSTINLSGHWVATNGTGTLTVDPGTSTVNLDGTGDQNVITNNQAFYNLSLNNTGIAGSDDIIINGNLDVDGTLTITDGDLDIGTNDPTVNTAGDITIGANGSIDVTGRTASWTFDGTSTLTDSSSGGPQDLEDVVVNGAGLTLGSSTRVKTMTVTGGTLDLGDSGYTLEIDGTGTPLTVSSTFDAGASTTKYTGTGALTNIAAVAYDNLQLSPSAATTYQLTGDLTGANAMTGDLTIDANATLDATAANSYDISTQNVTIDGTYLGQASTITAAGNWDHSGGAFAYGTSTLIMTGAGKSITTPAGNQFYNLTIDSGATTTAQSSFGLFIDGTLTISGTFNISAGNAVHNQNDLVLNDNATLGGAGQYTQIRRADSVGDTFGTGITISVGTYFYDALYGVDVAPGKTLTGATYGGDLIIRGSGNYFDQFLHVSGGDLTVDGTLIILDGWGPNCSVILDNSVENRNITAGNLVVGNSGATNKYAKLIAGSGTIDINGDVTIHASDASGTNEIDAGTANWTVSGNWINNDTFTAGTSTVTLDGGNQTISGSNTFYNLSKTKASNDGTDVTLTFDNTGTQTVTGTLTLDGLDDDDRINLVSDSPGNQWSLVLGAGATKAIDYVDVQDSDASGSDPSQKPIDAPNAVDSGNNTDWFDYVAPTQVNNIGSIVSEGGTDTITNTELRYDDSEQPASNVTYNVTGGLVNGQLELTTNLGVSITTFTQAQIDAGQVVYVHNGSNTTSDSFNFSVDDSRGNTLAGQSFALTITPVNDAPVVNDQVFAVAENSVNNTVVGTVAASDPEPGDTLTYSITGGNTGGAFAIDPSTGQITVANSAALDFEVNPSFALSVQVQDDGTGNLTDSATVTVNLTDVNLSFAGTAFAADGVTPLGAGTTVRLLVNGSDAGTGVTAADGSFSVNAEANAGDAVLLFLDNDPANKGTTVTVSDGGNLSGITVRADHVIVRQDNGGVLTNADMAAALGAYSDTDIGYSVSGGVVTVTASWLEVAAGHSFTLTGDASVQGIRLLGTLDADSYTITVADDWDAANGIFTAGSSTIVIGTNGQTSTITTDPAAGWWDPVLNNVTVVAGSNVDFSMGTAFSRIKILGHLEISGTLEVQGGQMLTLAYGQNRLTINAGGELTGAGVFERVVDDVPVHIANNGTISVDTFQYGLRHWGTDPMPVTATTYGNNLIIKNWGSLDWDGVLGRAPGDTTSDLVVGGTLTILHDRVGKTLSLDNSVDNIDIQVGNLVVGDVGNDAVYSYFNSGSATVTVAGDVIIAGADVPGSNVIDADSSTWNVGGNWTNNDTFTAGSSTVTLNGAGQSISGDSTFYNFQKSTTSADVLTFAAGSTQSITGLVTLEGISGNLLSLRSDSPGSTWNFVLPSGTAKVIDYVDVQDSDASGSDPGLKPIDAPNAVDSGNNTDWFDYVAPVQVNNSGSTVTEGGTDTLTNSELRYDDSVQPASSVTYTVTGGLTNGQLELITNLGVSITTFTQAQVDAGQVVYIHGGTNTTADSFNFSVDDGRGNTLAGQTFNLTITPVNDAPVINNATFALNENSANGTAVGTVPVNDPDAGDTHVYTITAGNTGGAFTIDNAGNITVANSTALNFETTPVFTLTVQVQDQGGTGLIDTATITVNLNDINDAPVINNATFALDENSANGTAVGTVPVTDVDAGDTHVYSITAGNTGGAFTIDNAANITVANSAALNFETNPVFTLTVQVQDQGGTGLIDTATITINLNDLNDAPAINDASFNVDENSTNGTAVGTVPVTDPDAGDTHVYTITAGNTGGAFAIDNAGNITVANSAALNFETTPVFTLTVQVQDQGGTGLIDTATITVNLNNLNEAPITSGIGNVTVGEDAPNTVIDLFAAFADTEDADASLTYTITANTNPGLFAATPIDGVAGTLTLDYAPNANGTAGITLRATDTGGLWVESTFTVTINPVNDAPATTPVTLTAINEDGGARLITQAELLTNAADVDGPALTATNLTISAGSGTLVDNGDGTWAYTPALNDDTSVSFTYSVTDGSLTAAGSATLDITPVNDAPVTNNDSATVDEGQNVVINLVGNDTDVENALDFSSITITAAPTNGTLVDNGDGTLTYDHDGSKTNSDRFSYTINDVSGATSNIAAVSLTVNSANDNDPSDSTDPVLILDDPVTDEDEDSDIENPTYEAPGEDPLTEDEVVSPVEAYQTPQDLGDADESIVAMKDPQDEETQEIIYLTDEIDRNTQSEGRDDERGYTYYDNDLYKDMSSLKYWNLIDYAAQSEPVAVNLDDISFLDFDSDDSDPVGANDDYDALRQEIDESFNSELKSQGIKAKIVTATAATFTVGIVSYLLRAGSLVASMMSALPLWRGFDPIAIFSGDRKKKKKKNEISDAGELKPEAFFDGDAE